MANIRKYIEESNWDEWMDRAFEYLAAFSWAVIAFAVIYFGGVFMMMGLR